MRWNKARKLLQTMDCEYSVVVFEIILCPELASILFFLHISVSGYFTQNHRLHCLRERFRQWSQCTNYCITADLSWLCCYIEHGFCCSVIEISVAIFIKWSSTRYLFQAISVGIIFAVCSIFCNLWSNLVYPAVPGVLIEDSGVLCVLPLVHMAFCWPTYSD